MTRDRYRQIKEAFLEALERPEAEREAFVAQRAAGDEELAREVRSLLLHHEPVDAPRSQRAPIDRSSPTQPYLGGTAIGQGADVPKHSKVAATPSPAPSGSASRSSLKIDRGRFAPGSVIAARYRIVDLIARGGMGEVYRADDLKLGEPVALKFLPKSLANDKHWLDRFLDEIRVARNVSHPNVCRVYDVGEDLGEHFLTMEYVEGETLSSLQSRIGRLPQRKAEQLAQQLCAGLAAIHDAGILHRDLKPSNILIDDRGQVKVTDFGLSAAGEIKGYQAAAGTPGYVAPESLSGVEATARSDIYQLGLLLFELFTGRPGYIAEPGEDLLSRQQKGDPPAPSTVAPDIKPRVEQVIQQCLDRDPASRPASARQVARMLPGGDPLAAALEAGETPSPSMVAMAGKRGTLRPGLAAAAVGVFMILVATAIFLGSRGASVMAMASLDKPPAVLADNARQILAKLGYEPSADEPGHEAWAMDLYEELIGEIERTDTSADRWERLRRERPSPIDFWYRWSPEPLGTNKPTGRLSMNDPPQSIGGMIAVRLTPKGRLRELAVVDRRTGTQVDPASGLPAGQPGPPEPEPNWDIVFHEAGLERAKFVEVPKERIPPVFATDRRAWLGVYPESPDTRIRVEIATLNNRIVAFRTVEVGLNLDQTGSLVPVSERKQLGKWASQGVLALTVVGAVVLAFRNTRAKRGDRSGATRAAVVIAITTVLMLLLQAGTLRYDDVPLGNLGWMLAVGIAAGLGVWVLYVAVEPYVRRLWPESIISWTRLIQGRFTDPLVGQSLLVGALVGAAGMCVVYVNRLMPGWMGLPPAQPYLGSRLGATVLEGTRQALGSLIQCGLEGVRMAMLMFVGVVLVKLIVRRTWLALTLFGLAQTGIWMLNSATLNAWSWPVLGVSGTLVAGLMALALAALVRYGVLALMAAASVLTALGSLPITFNFEKWHAGVGMLGLGVVCAVAFYGAACAVVGRGK